MKKEEPKKKKLKSASGSSGLKKAANKMARGDSTQSKTSTASKTATATKTSTSTDAYTQGNITVTGGAGAGNTAVTIEMPKGWKEGKGKNKS